MSIISSIFKAFSKPKPSPTQQLDSMLQEISKNPAMAKVMNDVTNEYEQICKIKKEFMGIPAWSDVAPSIMDQLDQTNDQYGMADFYHDVGSIVYWTLMDIIREVPELDMFDPYVIGLALEEVMTDIAEETDGFKAIDPQHLKLKLEIAKEDAMGS